MGSLGRLFTEYLHLRRILNPGDFSALLAATVRLAPSVIRDRTLTGIDAAMSRDLRIHYRGTEIQLPLAEIDRLLIGTADNPTFGNVREIFGRDCYMGRFQLNGSAGPVLDLGANRGIFSILALTAMKAERVVGVEPLEKYDAVIQALLAANGIPADRQCRYRKLVASPSMERGDSVTNLSIETIRREQRLDRIALAKIDIEGAEKDLFAEPEWLAWTDNIAMEVHPGIVGDLSLIPAALNSFGFRHIAVDQAGNIRNIQEAMFVYASRTGALVG